jgi:two-component system, sensor histidine kinase
MDAKPDPEDGTHTLLTYLMFRGCDVLGAALYLTALPWWQPLGWLAVVTATGTLRLWACTRPGFLKRPSGERRRAYRLLIWLHAAGIGSAGLLVFASGDPFMQTLLGVHMFGAATVAALRLCADFVRNAVAIPLIIGPTALHVCAEGAAHQNLVQILMGVGGGLMIASVIVASRYHERNLNQQVEQRQRAECAADALASLGLAKSRFFAAVSHDLRQPLHAIGLYLDPLDQLSRQTANQEAQRAVAGIRLCWHAVDGLLSQALDLARMHAGAMRPNLVTVDLAPLVRSMVTQHWPAAERAGVRLVVFAADGRLVLADPLMLARVVSNLLDNAIKFSPRGGIVAVAVRRGRDAWRIQVRDAGSGIPPRAQEQVFEEFVQIDSAVRDRQLGYGLGLAISRRFTRLMLGNLTVRSDTGRGCCMTITLQRADASHAESAP